MDFLALIEHLARLPASPDRYPDAAAAIEAKLPPTKREAERRLWAEAVDRAFGPQRPVDGLALDAGCGDGEYLAELSDCFEDALGFDADARRVAVSRKRCPEVPSFALKVAPDAVPVLAGQLRFAQCLQVLGHVSTSAAAGLVTRLAGWLSPGSPLLLALPYTNQPFDDFRISEIAVAESRRVEREEYDRVADDPQPGTLPVRHFSMPSVLALLAGARLSQDWTSPYGWLSYEHADLMVLARKR